MTREVCIMRSRKDRDKAMAYVRCAPLGYEVEIREPDQTAPQRRKMHALIDDFAEQVTHSDGQKHPPWKWKLAFMHKLGHETEFMPSLDGDELLPLGKSTRGLRKHEISAMIELIYAEGAIRGVAWSEPAQQEAA